MNRQINKRRFAFGIIATLAVLFISFAKCGHVYADIGERYSLIAALSDVDGDEMLAYGDDYALLLKRELGFSENTEKMGVYNWKTKTWQIDYQEMPGDEKHGFNYLGSGMFVYTLQYNSNCPAYLINAEQRTISEINGFNGGSQGLAWERIDFVGEYAAHWMGTNAGSDYYVIGKDGSYYASGISKAVEIGSMIYGVLYQDEQCFATVVDSTNNSCFVVYHYADHSMDIINAEAYVKKFTGYSSECEMKVCGDYLILTQMEGEDGNNYCAILDRNGGEVLPATPCDRGVVSLSGNLVLYSDGICTEYPAQNAELKNEYRLKDIPVLDSSRTTGRMIIDTGCDGSFYTDDITYGWFWEDKEMEPAEVYYLGKAFQRISGTIYLGENAPEEWDETFYLFGDGKQLFEKGGLKRSNASAAFEVDVSGVEVLSVVHKGLSSMDKICLSGAMLTRGDGAAPSEASPVSIAEVASSAEPSAPSEADSSSGEKSSETAPSTPSETQLAPAVTADEYILPDSNVRYLETKELTVLSKKQLRIARNEIYARHGRRFKDQELQAYFDGCSWYQGTVDPDSFDEGVLNKYEKKNAEQIAAVENSDGSSKKKKSSAKEKKAKKKSESYTYILPTSSDQKLKEEDLSGLTASELRIARNEIYARHGRRFKDKSLQTYFDGCGWYQGTIAPDDFDESVLSKTEKANAKLIKNTEKKRTEEGEETVDLEAFLQEFVQADVADAEEMVDAGEAISANFSPDIYEGEPDEVMVMQFLQPICAYFAYLQTEIPYLTDVIKADMGLDYAFDEEIVSQTERDGHDYFYCSKQAFLALMQWYFGNDCVPSDAVLISAGFTVDGDYLYYPVGDDGIDFPDLTVESIERISEITFRAEILAEDWGDDERLIPGARITLYLSYEENTDRPHYYILDCSAKPAGASDEADEEMPEDEFGEDAEASDVEEAPDEEAEEDAWEDVDGGWISDEEALELAQRYYSYINDNWKVVVSDSDDELVYICVSDDSDGEEKIITVIAIERATGLGIDENGEAFDLNI